MDDRKCVSQIDSIDAASNKERKNTITIFSLFKYVIIAFVAASASAII